MTPIRILQVLASLDRGGAETMLMNIYREIDRTKIQFDFIVNEQEKRYSYESEIEKMGGRVYRIPKYKIINYYSYKRYWKDLISKHPEWKIVHGHHTSPAFIYIQIAKSLKRLTIAHSHTSGGDITVKSFVKRLTRYPLRYIADYQFACSKSAAQWMFGDGNEYTHIINNAIDTKKYIFEGNIRENKRKELDIEGKFVIGHVGRFDIAKNQEFLIDIFKEVYFKNKDAILLLVGDGELRKSLEKKVENLGLNKAVIFTGVRSDVPEILQAMDVFVFPSLYEGLPVTLIEAQAAGLPCIVSDTITKEVSVTSLVEYISINREVDLWINEIIKYKEGFIRKNTEKKIIQAGYSVVESTKWLQDFYINKISEL